MRLARGFSPPKADPSGFDRGSARRTSLRGRRFGEQGERDDPLSYALGRQMSTPNGGGNMMMGGSVGRKNELRRLLSSSAYRAEPDGIDHAALSKASSRP